MSSGTLTAEVRWPRATRFVSLKLYYFRAVRRKRLDGILELLGLVMGTIVTGLQWVHKDTLKRDLCASLSKAAPYFNGSEHVLPGPTSRAILVEWGLKRVLSQLSHPGTMRLQSHFVDKLTFGWYLLYLHCSLLVSFSFQAKAEFLSRGVFYCSWSWGSLHTTSRFILFPAIIMMEGIWLSENPLICRSVTSVPLKPSVSVKQYGHYRESVSVRQ